MKCKGTEIYIVFDFKETSKNVRTRSNTNKCDNFSLYCNNALKCYISQNALQCILVLYKVIFNICFVIYLDSREGDSRGGVGADHQRQDGGAQRTKHVGQLQGKHMLVIDQSYSPD